MASSRLRVFLVVSVVVLILGFSISTYYTYFYPYLLNNGTATAVATPQTPAAVTNNTEDLSMTTAARIVKRGR